MHSNNGFFGRYGGSFVPETLIPALDSLAHAFNNIKENIGFQTEFKALLNEYAGRPTPITFAKNLSIYCGFEIYLKREDLLHTGAHKINNTIGQCLLAKYMGKKRVIAETGAGQHGVATAAACARLNLNCVIYMGRVDIERQKPNVDRMRLLGAEVIPVDEGSRTLKDAVNFALRDYVANVESTHYVIGSVVGPYPYPEMVAFFQKIIGEEAREYFKENLPDVIVACVGGGSNAIGIFQAFLDTDVSLIGVEAGGISDKEGMHARTIGLGSDGILHGSFTKVLSDKDGQILPVHSISAGLDYPGVGPQHAYLSETKRVKYFSVGDKEAIEGFKMLSQREGIIPALESSHAIGWVLKNRKRLSGKRVLINLSGRGDKDMESVKEFL